MFAEDYYVKNAQGYVRSIMGSASHALGSLTEASEHIDAPSNRREVYQELLQQLWALEDLASSIEHRLAQF